MFRDLDLDQQRHPVEWKCVANGSFHVVQSPPELLKEGLCPALLMPSKACKLKLLFVELLDEHEQGCFELYPLLPSVTRRCLPALGTMKGGVVVVGNETSFDDGQGVTFNASDVLEASK